LLRGEISDYQLKGKEKWKQPRVQKRGGQSLDGVNGSDANNKAKKGKERIPEGGSGCMRPSRRGTNS